MSRPWMMNFLAALAVTAPGVVQAGSVLVGKPPAIATFERPRLLPTENPVYGVANETPNQRRRRLGLSIPNYAAPVRGEALETPNQRRRRLGILSASTEKPAEGLSLETPNQRRRRLAAQSF